MGYKIFVSYKYWDNDVYPIHRSSLPTLALPKVRDYVDWLEVNLRKVDRNLYPGNSNIYKGEHNNEDLSDKTDEYIWRSLKDRIYDSSVTIILISPNMKEVGKWERNQWIPWEISYSISETTRNNYTSHSNAILAVVLPNKLGRYDYYSNLKLFNILQKNIDIGYIPVIRWDQFKYNCNYYIEKAIEAKKNTPSYLLTKRI